MEYGDAPAGSRERTTGASPFYAGGLSVASYDLFVGSELSPLRGDVEFYLSCAGRFGGPVLELGAGTGRIVWPLAVAGHGVVGLDQSTAMLAIAQGKAALYPAVVRDRVELRQGDMNDSTSLAASGWRSSPRAPFTTSSRPTRNGGRSAASGGISSRAAT